LRLVGGRLRGKLLTVPEGLAIRPTADRARENLFNILEHGRAAKLVGLRLNGAHVLDAFAGTGALGLETFSRGAARVTFMDNTRMARRVLELNIAACKAGDSVDIRDCDVTNPPLAPAPADLVFLDPPYGADLLVPALEALEKRGWHKDSTLIVAECGANEALTLPDFLVERDRRRYGAAQFILLSHRMPTD